MIQITIDSELKAKNPSTYLGCIICDVETEKFNSELWQDIKEIESEIISSITNEMLKDLPNIKESRNAYKIFGKDPNRYKISSESLVKRIIDGKGLYQINSVVDTNNYISLKSLFSVGSYDLQKIEPPIIFRIGNKNEIYESLSRDNLNIENLPLLSDKIGAFGSPTSDSKRTIITLETKQIIMILFSFSNNNFKTYFDLAEKQLKRFVNAQNFEFITIG